MLSHVVPVSGLVLGHFFRIENELKTALELWDVEDNSSISDTSLNIPKDESDLKLATVSSESSIPRASSTQLDATVDPDLATATRGEYVFVLTIV